MSDLSSIFVHFFSIKEWQLLITSSEDIRRDLLEKESIKKVFGDVSNLMRGYSNQVHLIMGLL